MTALHTAPTLFGVESMPVEEFYENLFQLVKQVRDRHEKYTVISDNRPSAVVVSVEEWDRMTETLAVLSDPQTRAELREAEEAEARGETYGLDEVIAEFRERRRR